MSIYDNETKTYPGLNGTALQEPQSYWLNNLCKIEAFFLNEIEKCEQKVKKIKQSITILSIAEASLITSTVLTGGTSIAALASHVGMPVGIALGVFVVLFSLFPATWTYLKASIVAREKHDSIKLVAQGKFDSTANIILRAMQDRDISPTEFYRILKEEEKYHKLKADINKQAIAKLKNIMKEEREKNTWTRKKIWKIWSSSNLWHVILWSIKTIKIGLKFVFPICRINFRIQHLTSLNSVYEK